MNIFSALSAGRMVANPTAWKRGQVTANMVVGLLAFALSFLKGTRYDPHMDDATVAYIGGGLFAVVNWLFTVASTDKIGLVGQSAQVAAVAGGVGNADAQGAQHDPAPVASQPADTSAPDPMRHDGIPESPSA